MSMDRAEAILAEVEGLLEGSAFEVVDVTLGRVGNRHLVRVYLDREGGISIEDCARMSRAIGDHLEARGTVPGAYVLEVSSPGIDRPLRRAQDYRRFSGERAEVETYEKVEGRRHHVGVLSGYAEEGDLVLLAGEGGETVAIPRGAIRKAHLKRDPWEGRRRGR
jgi:ribosome maturation factor RimP